MSGNTVSLLSVKAALPVDESLNDRRERRLRGVTPPLTAPPPSLLPVHRYWVEHEYLSLLKRLPLVTMTHHMTGRRQRKEVYFEALTFLFMLVRLVDTEEKSYLYVFIVSCAGI